MSTRTSRTLLALFVLTAGGMFAWAQATAPRAMPYQGRLELDGSALEGLHTLTFRFYADAAADVPLGGEIVRDVNVSQGVFATVLSPVPDEAFDGSEVWLAVSVDGTLLAGRQQLLSVPFAMGTVAKEELTLSGGLRIGRGDDPGTGLAGALTPDSTIRIPIGGEGAGGLDMYDAQAPDEQGARVVYNSAAETLELQNVDATLEYRNDGTLRPSTYGADGCPADMERIGGFCIDRVVHPAAPIADSPGGFGSTAMGICHAEGKNLCGIAALMLCDVVQPSNGPDSCTNRTDKNDDPNYRIASTDIAYRYASAEAVPFGHNAFDNFSCYDPTTQEAQNSLDACNDSQPEEFFCCIAAPAFARPIGP